MKNINKIAALLIGLFLFAACDSKLDIEPQNSLDESKALANAENLESALTGAYSTLYSGSLYGSNMNLLSELLAGEDNVEWYGTFKTYIDLYNKQQVANNGEASRTWIQAYNLINITNNIIGAIGVLKEEDRDRVKGEALFLRGLIYFELVRFYGMPWKAGDANNTPEMGVPIVLTATKSIQDVVKVKRNTVSEVYNQLIADLLEAAEKLPESNKFRATSFAAKALLARVYLQKSDFENALKQSDEVVTNGNYELLEDIKTVFTVNNSSEAIFEVLQNEQHNAGRVNDGLATFYSDNGFGRGDVDVNPLRKKFDPDDLRRTDLIYKGAKFGGRHSLKWTDPAHNIAIIRLAEMYLIRAEVNARLGSAVGATPLEDLEKIRSRAGLATLSATVEDIIQERVYELAFEGHRLHDIKRTMGKTGDFNYDDPKLILPIPQRERDVNTNLKQNEGY